MDGYSASAPDLCPTCREPLGCCSCNTGVQCTECGNWFKDVDTPPDFRYHSQHFKAKVRCLDHEKLPLIAEAVENVLSSITVDTDEDVQSLEAIRRAVWRLQNSWERHRKDAADLRADIKRTADACAELAKKGEN